MPTPLKPQGLRQRRNKATTRSSLRATSAKAPALPMRACPCGGAAPQPRKRTGRPRKQRSACAICDGTGLRPWHHLTKAWWSRVWSSPMGPEYIEADLDGLYITAGLVDVFWHTGGTDARIAGEIRQQMARFGMSPLDRRRLEWTIERSDEDDQAASSSSPPPQAPGTDARAILRAVK